MVWGKILLAKKNESDLTLPTGALKKPLALQPVVSRTVGCEGCLPQGRLASHHLPPLRRGGQWARRRLPEAEPGICGAPSSTLGCSKTPLLPQARNMSLVRMGVLLQFFCPLPSLCVCLGQKKPFLDLRGREWHVTQKSWTLRWMQTIWLCGRLS